MTVASLLHDEIPTIDIEELELDDGLALNISFSDEDLGCTVDYDTIYSSDSQEASGTITVSKDRIAPFTCTFGELTIIANALLNATESCLEELNKTSLDAETRSLLTQHLSDLEMYKNKVDNFLSQFSPKKPR